MTEASKQRMEGGAVEYAKAVAPESIEQWVAGGYRKGYQAGMRDPEAGKDSLAVVNLIHADEKIRELQVAFKDLLEEKKKLREAMQFAVDHLSSMDDYSIVNGAIHSLKEALSSGGE